MTAGRDRRREVGALEGADRRVEDVPADAAGDVLLMAVDENALGRIVERRRGIAVDGHHGIVGRDDDGLQTRERRSGVAAAATASSGAAATTADIAAAGGGRQYNQ